MTRFLWAVSLLLSLLLFTACAGVDEEPGGAAPETEPDVELTVTVEEEAPEVEATDTVVTVEETETPEATATEVEAEETVTPELEETETPEDEETETPEVTETGTVTETDVITGTVTVTVTEEAEVEETVTVTDTVEAETPETGELTPTDVLRSSALSGFAVTNADGDEVAQIEDMVIDPQTGQVSYVLVSPEGATGDAVVPIPWDMLEWSMTEEAFVLDVDEQTLQDAPSFEEFPPTDTGWEMEVDEYWENP